MTPQDTMARWEEAKRKLAEAFDAVLDPYTEDIANAVRNGPAPIFEEDLQAFLATLPIARAMRRELAREAMEGDLFPTPGPAPGLGARRAKMREIFRSLERVESDVEKASSQAFRRSERKPLFGIW